jgi:hypothetical protein
MGSCNNNIKNAPSAGQSGGCVYASANGYPWIGDDGILYGFVASGYCGDGQGACYEFTFDNGMTANVQVTNCGGDVDSIDPDTGKRKNCDGGDDDSRRHVFDFMVPGGGFGIYNACDNMPGWTIMEDSGGVCAESGDNDLCYRYGGLNSKDLCNKSFPEDEGALNACENILFNTDIFPSGTNFPGNPTITNIKKIDCPPQLTSRSGLSGEDVNDPVTEGTTINNACMTHYWDCAKPDVAWDKTPTSNTDSECQNGSMTAIIVDDNGNQVSTVPDSCGGGGGTWDDTPCCSYDPYVECGDTTGYCASEYTCENDCGGKWIT